MTKAEFLQKFSDENLSLEKGQQFSFGYGLQGIRNSKNESIFPIGVSQAVKKGK